MRKISFLILILSSLTTLAQQVKDSVKTEVIEVTRSFDPKVQDAYKLDVNPEMDATPEAKIRVDYHIQSVPVASTFQPEKGSMANFRPGSMIENIFGSYVSLSGGNYTQLQADAYVSYPVSDHLTTALNLSHYSSQGGEQKDVVFNPFYHTEVDGLINYKTDGSDWQFDLGYDGHINRLKEDMGMMMLITPDIESFDNKYNNFHLDVKSRFKDIFIKNLGVRYNNFWDFSDNSEHLAQLKADFVFPVGDINIKTGVQTDMVSGNSGKDKHINPATDFNLSYSNFDLGLLPAVTIENGKLVANLGAKIFYQNDTIYKKVQFIPDVNVHLNLIYEKLTVFGGVTGDLHQNSQTEFYQKIPYMGLVKYMHPTLVPYNIFGGFEGAFSSSFAYEVRLGVKRINNYAFFNYTGFQPPLAGYGITYDDMTQSYFMTKLNIGVGKKLDLKLDLTYMQNNPDNLTKALFVPDFDFKSILIFKPNDKLNIHTTLHSVSERSYAVGLDKSLKPYTDFNLGIRYNINKQLTGFVEAYNLLNQDYQIYYMYPVQKLQFMAGVAYRFDIPVQK